MTIARPDRMRVVDQATTEVVECGRGWTVDRWVVVEATDSTGRLPRMRIRAEVVPYEKAHKAVITELTMGGEGERVLPRQVRAVHQLMPELPAEALSLVAFAAPNVEPNPDDFVRAMNAMIRQPNLSAVERQEQVLHEWETHYQPSGATQEEAAYEMGLKPRAFRTYLSRARARRK